MIFFYTFFKNTPIENFMKIRQVEAELFHEERRTDVQTNGRTDRRTDGRRERGTDKTKVIVAFGILRTGLKAKKNVCK